MVRIGFEGQKAIRALQDMILFLVSTSLVMAFGRMCSSEAGANPLAGFHLGTQRAGTKSLSVSSMR